MPEHNLPDDLFWEILATTQNDPEQLQEYLSTQDRSTLIAFHRSFRKAIDDLWASPVLQVVSERGSSTDDAIRYLFISIIAAGKNSYYRTLNYPELAPQIAVSNAGQLYSIVGRVFWNRFRQEIELPEAEMSPPILGEPVAVLIPAGVTQVSQDSIQRSIKDDFDAAGYGERLISFSADREEGYKYEYLVDDLKAFSDLTAAIVGKHLPGEPFEIQRRSE